MLAGCTTATDPGPGQVLPSIPAGTTDTTAPNISALKPDHSLIRITDPSVDFTSCWPSNDIATISHPELDGQPGIEIDFVDGATSQQLQDVADCVTALDMTVTMETVDADQ